MDHGLTLLSTENIELKGEIISLLIKKNRTLEKLMELGTKHAVQSSLYDLEHEGFITRRVKETIFSYQFNRDKILFKIQKDLEQKYEKLVKEKDFYTSNDCLFYCDHCKNLYEYTKAMENGFSCCGERVKSFDSNAIVQSLMEKMAYIEDKLGALSKI